MGQYPARGLPFPKATYMHSFGKKEKSFGINFWAGVSIPRWDGRWRID